MYSRARREAIERNEANPPEALCWAARNPVPQAGPCPTCAGAMRASGSARAETRNPVHCRAHAPPRRVDSRCVWPPPLFRDRPVAVQIFFAVVAPIAFGALCGYELGRSQTVFQVLMLLAGIGGIAAGFEHP